MSKYLSDKLTVLYTLLIVMVVYIHSTYLEGAQYASVSFLQRFIGGGLCRVANCLFFCLSGYLFARSIGNIKNVFAKQRKRFRTLIPPYILWNVIFVLWYVVLYVTPGVDRWVNSDIIPTIMQQPIGQTLKYLFIGPAAFQLWFLRDLIVFVVLTPVLWWITDRTRVFAILIALASIFIYPWLVYFWLGIIVASMRWDIDNYSPQFKTFGMICGIVYIGASVAIGCGVQLHSKLLALTNICGLAFIWVIYDVLSKRQIVSTKGIWRHICGYSFFIYCFHEPAFNIIKKIPIAFLGDAPATLTVFYLINPWIMIVVAIIVARLINKITPKTYKVLTGGR